jgi:hypothetical protein
MRFVPQARIAIQPKGEFRRRRDDRRLFKLRLCPTRLSRSKAFRRLDTSVGCQNHTPSHTLQLKKRTRTYFIIYIDISPDVAAGSSRVESSDGTLMVAHLPNRTIGISGRRAATRAALQGWK